MASIKGIELKDMTMTKGKEYPVDHHGIIYLNGKKLGRWDESKYGGNDFYDFDTAEIEKLSEEYYTERGIKTYSLDCLLSEILKLYKYEEFFKEAQGKGYEKLIVCRYKMKLPDGTPHDYGQPGIVEFNGAKDEAIEFAAQTLEKDIKKMRKEGAEPVFTVYESLEDFIIT